MKYKIFLFLGLFFMSSIIYSQNSYLNENENTKILKEILKEIEQLKKGQDKLSKELATLKAAPANQKSGGTKGGKKNVPIGNSMVLGKKDAPITIVEWTDFQWPYCAKSVSLVDEVLAKYPNDVKVVVKNFPLSFHKQARTAAKYALAADRQGKYKEMFHMIFCGTTESVPQEQCNAWRKLKANEHLPLEYAAELGLDVEKLKKDALDPYFEQLIKKESLELAQNFERKSVPKFLIAGKEPAKRSLEAWSAIIDAELKNKK